MGRGLWLTRGKRPLAAVVRSTHWCEPSWRSLFSHQDPPTPPQQLCCCLVTKLILTLYNLMDTAHQAALSFTISRSCLKLMSTESVMPSNHLILCCPFSRLQSFPASGSFIMSQFFESGGQSIGASASASVLPMKIQG